MGVKVGHSVRIFQGRAPQGPMQLDVLRKALDAVAEVIPDGANIYDASKPMGNQELWDWLMVSWETEE